MTDNISNLNDYGPDFLTKIVEVLIAHPDFYIISKGQLRREFLDNSEPHKQLLSWIDLYFEKHNAIPDVAILRTINNINPNPIVKDKCSYILDQIQVSIDSKFDFKHYEFYIEQLSRFIKRKIYEQTFKECLPLLGQGKFDDIDIKFHHAIDEVDFDVSIKDYIETFDERVKPESRKCVPTGWSWVDDVLSGGVGFGEMACLVGELGVGKSWCLTQLSINAMKAGFNVLHISMENRIREVSLRYDSLITKTYLGNIYKEKETVKEKLLNFFKTEKSGRVYVEEFASGGISIPEIYGLVRKYQNKTKRKIHLLIVDYIDILDLSSYAGEEWKQLKSASEDLRKLAFNLEMAVWTATHPNVEGIKSEMIKYHQVSGGAHRFKVIDFVFAFNRKLESSNQDRPKLQIVKNRIGPTGGIFTMAFDVEKEVIVDVLGVTSSEELKKGSQGEQNSTLKEFRKRMYSEKEDIDAMEEIKDLFQKEVK